MIRASLIGLSLLVSASFVMAAEKPKHTTDSIETVKQNLKEKKALLLDVREVKEWKAGHLEVAKLVPLSSLREDSGAATKKAELPKDTILYLHCRSGGRVLLAAELLTPLGYEVRPLKWGYDALCDEGFQPAK